MQYPNAKIGLNRLFISELLAILAAAATIIATILGVVVIVLSIVVYAQELRILNRARKL